MEGELEGIDLVEILQVVSIGRQYTGVELRKADHSVVGTLFVKSGKVVAAASGDVTGKDAFFLLFQRVHQEPRKFFQVFRTETPPQLPSPLGTLGTLLLEAMERTKHAALPAPQQSPPPSQPKSGTMPRPPQPNEASVERAKTVPPHVPFAPAKAPSSARNKAVAPPPDSSRGRVVSPDPVRPIADAPFTRTVADASFARPAADAPFARATTRPSSAQMPAVHAPVRNDVQPPIKQSGGGGRGRVVMAVVSPKGGSGKTTISLNLAISLARQSRSVILLDADINGDVLSSINARHRAEVGVFDVLLGRANVESAFLRTVLPNFRILPALGQRLPDAAELAADHTESWRSLLGQLSEQAEIVLVDTPAGMFGPTGQIALGCTHLLGVLQAELIASRSFSMFKRAIDGMPPERRPEVAGVVLNMLQSRQGGSLSVLQDACSGLPRSWLLDTTIPRSDAFLSATEQGSPLRLMDDTNPPAVSWLFDMLATELSERLALGAAERHANKLLL